MWLGRFNKWPPAYWHRLSWGEFRAYLIEARRRQQAMEKETRRAQSGVPEYEEGGYDDPDADQLRAFPWAGEGDDPLEQLWEQS